MSPAELDALGVSTDLRTAARALGIGKSMAYRLADQGKFPCPIMRIGSRWVVPTAGLRAALGLTEATA
ncbi:helix-turn-helix domain-containing protein [Tsukamurella asaccharolytica]|uniref:Helix-turn-helix domain-containing protein n=2 Tax=Tsukamurella asaccharolytica TaxID=2592067 RepID=A0A5C5REJ9_9ACTN|nr:helix-turn-helix domain-containing protein [Tsukamurella asaccharolytica]